MQQYEATEFLSRYMNTEDDAVELFQVLDKLPPLSKNGPWLAGGAVRRTLIMQSLNSDFDFFFRDGEQLAEFRKALTEKGATKSAQTDHHETYTITINEKPRIIQLIKIGFYGSVGDVLDSFDFTITQCAYDGCDLFVGDYTLWDLARKRLALHKLTYGVATMRRLLKYTRQGFTACAGTMQSILEAAVDDPSVINSDVQYVD